MTEVGENAAEEWVLGVELLGFAAATLKESGDEGALPCKYYLAGSSSFSHR